MHVAFDAVMLSVYLHPHAKAPKPIDRLPERIQLLVDELEASGAKIIIPAPVLSEFLVLVGNDGAVYLSELTNSEVFDIQPFDLRSAIEAAEMHRKADAAGDKRAGSPSRWQVAKVDRQFVAIAKVNGVSCIYSDDAGVKKMAETAGIAVKGVADLPAPPPSNTQLPLLVSIDPSSSGASSGSEQPSAQSPDDEQAKGRPFGQGRPSAHRGAPAPPQPGSSPDVPPRARSTK
jgi:hypothetical protein